MKILFVTDLHGNKSKYEMLFEAIKNHKADIVINCGDMLPKDGTLFNQDHFIREYLEDYFSQVDRAGIYYLCYLGNDDLRIFDDLFEKTCRKFSFVHNIAQRKVEIGGYEFIGMNWVADYPFRLKDRCRKDTEDYIFQIQLGKGLLSTLSGWCEIDDWFKYAERLPTIEDELSKLICPVDYRKAVYVIHMPPINLGLDKCSSEVEVGSKAVYDFIKKQQPMLTLHGHIHESPEMTGKWFNRLGKTLCIQPGQLKDKLTYALIDITTMEIKRFAI